ncbi:MAG: HipA domain-containing protein [Ignavibacteriales bacterium]|nr:HipA domain-containing protein [Ignavibacteriales bacterium]
MTKQKCLYCYQTLPESEKGFHAKCSKIFFDSPLPPVLEVNLSDIESLALNILGRNTSVTGVQPKLSVDLKKNKKEPARLTIVGLWGRYILKPPHYNFPEMPENEDLTMKLAESVGIKTASHSLIRMKSGELAYISKRFDRTAKEKLHVEDFAQLLEVLTERKYSGSIEQIGRGVLQYSSFPGNDLINIFEVVLFAFITGNADMHLKNFSLLRDENDDIKLSPAYDLISTKLLLPQDKEETALTINGKKSKFKREDFDYLYEKLLINSKTAAMIYKKYSDIIEQWFDLIKKCFLSEAAQTSYMKLIEQRMKQINLG